MTTNQYSENNRLNEMVKRAKAAGRGPSLAEVAERLERAEKEASNG